MFPIIKRIPIITLFLTFFIILAAIPAYVDAGGTYDGTYDYYYSFYGPGGLETHSVPSGFIVANGAIYSNPSAYTGSVDSAGNARFSGPCPQGGSATFSGVLHADGSGSGTYQGPSGVTGAWSVARVGGQGSGASSGDFAGDDFADALFVFFYDLGTAFGAPDDMAEMVGLFIVLIPVIVVITVAVSSSSRRSKQMSAKGGQKANGVHGTTEKRERGYAASPAGPAETGTIAPPITITANAHPAEAIGEVRSDSDLPARLDLRAAWTRDHVTLDWSRPGFDPALYRLDGYEVYVLKYGPGNTAPVKTLVAKLPPDAIRWMGPYNQTYRFSTGGDLNGYVVDALLKHITNTGQNEVLRIGATAFAPVH